MLCACHPITKRYGPLVARVALAALFLISGWGIITNFGGTVGFYTAIGLPMATLLAAIVLVVKIGGGLALVTGIHAREGALALAVFTVLATAIAHTAPGEMMNALKNIGIIGGLLMIVLHGPGPLSLTQYDWCCRNNKRDSHCANGSCDHC